MEFQKLRRLMVEEQIEGRGVIDKAVISALLKVERHKFVPAALAKNAYEDHPLPIGEGQTISQPYMAALMTELLGLSGTQKVLEVGTGCGYQTAILAELCKSVYSIEWFDTLRELTQARLEALGYKNIHLKTGDGRMGWPEEAPFDRVIVAAAAESIPAALFAQLAEGGVMVIPLGGPMSQVLTVARKIKGRLELFSSIPCVFVPLL